MRQADGDRHVMEEARLIMERQLGHMVRLIDDLLDISRVNKASCSCISSGSSWRRPCTARLRRPAR